MRIVKILPKECTLGKYVFFGHVSTALWNFELPEPSFRIYGRFSGVGIRWQLELEFPNILDRGWGPKYEIAGITKK